MYLSRNEILTNSTNTTDELDCLVPQTFVDYSSFATCYSFFAYNYKQTIFITVFFIISITSLNFLIIFLLWKRSLMKSIFNKILTWYCLANGLTGLIVIPLVHFVYLFGYWPLDYSISLFVNTLDLGSASVAILFMSYLSYARLRSLAAPNTFKTELLLRRPSVSLSILLIIGLGFWAVLTFSYGIDGTSMEINYNTPNIDVLYSFLGLIFPLIMTAASAFYFMFLLKRFKSRKKSLHANIKVPQSKKHAANLMFRITIIAFLVQWFLVFVFYNVNRYCGDCLLSQVPDVYYLVNFAINFTDAISILILNPNVRLCLRSDINMETTSTNRGK